jgi:transposase
MEQLTMSRKERERLVIFDRVKCGQMVRAQGAEVLGLSLRQMHRQFVRWRDEGAAGLLHRARGRASPRRWDAVEKTRAMELYKEYYRGFGPTLFAEKLAEVHGIWPSHDTARRWLKQAGLLETTRRGRRSRRRRERKACFGEMVQMDGSPHDWFEGRGPRCVLMTVIDDATGRRRGKFFGAETTEAAMTTLGLWCERFGVPQSLYVDRHGIYRSDRDPTAEELAAGRRPVTQFGRAMKELDVKLILARSPQAKGRVERSNGVMQDRLVKDLRLAKLDTIEAANAWLEAGGFWESIDEKFAVEATQETDAHRPLVVKLADVLCVKEKRSVGLDGCVQCNGRVLQLNEPGKLKGVEVWQRADGSTELLGDGRRLTWTQLDPAARQAERAAAQRRAKKRPIVNNKVHKPTARQQITLKPRGGCTKPAPALRKTG